MVVDSPTTSRPQSATAKEVKTIFGDSGHLLMSNQPIRRDRTDLFIAATQKALAEDSSRNTQLARIIRAEDRESYIAFANCKHPDPNPQSNCTLCKRSYTLKKDSGMRARLEQRLNPDIVILRKVCYICHRTVCSNCRDREIQLFPTEHEWEATILRKKKAQQKEAKQKDKANSKQVKDPKEIMDDDDATADSFFFMKLASGSNASVQKIVAFDLKETYHQHSLIKKAQNTGVVRAEPLKACKECVASCIEFVMRSTNKGDPNQPESTKAILGAVNEAVSLRTKISSSVSQIDGLSRLLMTSHQQSSLTFDQTEALYDEADVIAERVNQMIQRLMTLIQYATSPHTPKQPLPSLDSVYLKNLRLYATQALRAEKPKFMAALQRVEDAKSTPPSNILSINIMTNPSAGLNNSSPLNQSNPANPEFSTPLLRKNSHAHKLMLWKIKQLPPALYVAYINSFYAKQILSNPAIPPWRILLLGPGGPVTGPPPPSPPDSPLLTPPPQPFDDPNFMPLSIGGARPLNSSSSLNNSQRGNNTPLAVNSNLIEAPPSIHTFFMQGSDPSSPQSTGEYKPLFNERASSGSRRPSTGKRVSALNIAAGSLSKTDGLAAKFLKVAGNPTSEPLPHAPSSARSIKQINFVEVNFFGKNPPTHDLDQSEQHHSASISFANNSFAVKSFANSQPVPSSARTNSAETAFDGASSRRATTIHAGPANPSISSPSPTSGLLGNSFASPPSSNVKKSSSQSALFLTDEELALQRILQLEAQDEEEIQHKDANKSHSAFNGAPRSLSTGGPPSVMAQAAQMPHLISSPSAPQQRVRLAAPVVVRNNPPPPAAPRAAAMSTLQNLDSLLAQEGQNQIFETLAAKESANSRRFVRNRSALGLSALTSQHNMMQSSSTPTPPNSSGVLPDKIQIGGSHHPTLRRSQTGQTSTASYTPLFSVGKSDAVRGFSDSEDE
eukprot:GDKJ01046802.1.p1 GENE.GDKJ01046802.1~~GDKJ01046802.1.p1  ORF type:complete len:954 (-),score=206.38 GDKJ01046802.1:202-3063(-)